MDLEPLPTELRPIPALLKYYGITSLLAGPFFFFPLLFLFFRYRTLRYRLDEDGISMRWGALFRREVSLNYGRIQDIHLTSNVVERWLGLGKIQVQTASASSKAEMTVEGVPDLQAMRDFLYDRMKGAQGGVDGRAARRRGSRETRSQDRVAGPVGPASAATTDEDLADVLRDVASEVRSLRQVLERQSGRNREEPAP